jgi:hypothetical protein
VHACAPYFTTYMVSTAPTSARPGGVHIKLRGPHVTEINCDPSALLLKPSVITVVSTSHKVTKVYRSNITNLLSRVTRRPTLRTSTPFRVQLVGYF